MQNTGQILRSRKNGKSKYTAINNDILQSKTLTAQEKSILVHLLSLPEDWIVYKGLIWKDMNMGREQFNKHWKGLIDKGYIISIRMIDKDSNLVVGWNHVVYEEPVISDDRTNQDSDLLDSGQSENPSINKVYIKQSNNETKEVINKEINFELLWDLYGKKVAKEAAIKSFSKINPSLYEKIKSKIPFFKAEYPDPKFRPNFATFLNGKRWEDEFSKETIKAAQPFESKNVATLNDD
jgi:hypothetical protein